LQPGQGLAAARVVNATQANAQTLGCASVCAVKLGGQDLPGDVQPGGTVRRQCVPVCFQQVKQLAFVVA